MNPTEVQQLLDDLCVENGFCVSRLAQNRLKESPPQDVDSFARAIFTAEGLNPEYAGRQLFRLVRHRIAEAIRRSEIAGGIARE